jgi:hypothetical protein
MKQVCAFCGRVIMDNEDPQTARQNVPSYCFSCSRKKEMLRIIYKEYEIIDRERRKKEGRSDDSLESLE